MPIPQLRRLIVQQNIQRGTGRYYIPKGRRPKPRRRFSARRFFTYLLIFAVALGFSGTVGAIGLFAYVSRDLPDPDKISLRAIAQTTRIYDRTGEVLLYEVHGDEKRTIVELADIAQCAKDAAIAVEDKDFYNHHGFDLRGIARAIYTDILKGGKVQGGSTITQQFIKKAVLTDEKTFTRKIKELILAIGIEQRFSKDQILKMYLNQIPYGSVAYGIESASQTFFGKAAKDLTLSECAVLAALPQAPTYYSPYGTHRDALLARAHLILNLMVEQGYAAAAEAEAAKQDDVLARIVPKREAIMAPHFVFYVRELLAERFGDQAVERDGLKVVTTLDADKQKLAEEAITTSRDNIKKLGGNTAALLALDAGSGDILSMVGSADYFDDSINGKYNAVLGKLQPGSSIKPVVYAAAFEKGYTPSTVVDDVVTVFQKEPEEYKPLDYDQAERGPITLKEALAGSLNIPAVKTLYLTGIDRFIGFAERLGYTTFTDRSAIGLSLVLGGAEIRPIEHITAFTAFANEGRLQPARAILKVEDAAGVVLVDETKPPAGKKVFEAEIARNISAILADNEARAYIFGASNYLMLPDRPAAVKTGTTNDFKDAWTVGYTPSQVTGVWVGNANGSAMKKGADGSKVAAPIWNTYMRGALKGVPVETFTAPQPITTGRPILDGQKNAQTLVRIDRFSGKLATEFTPPELIEERGYGVPHSILHFVDKDNPLGPPPEQPTADPQYQLWEDALLDWIKRNNIIVSEVQPPTEFDDVHLPANAPIVKIINPSDNLTITERVLAVELEATAPRGIAKLEFYIDNDLINTQSYRPTDLPTYRPTITIPNRIAKGFRVLMVKAYDDAGNRSEAAVTINFIADPGPLGLRWVSPAWDGQFISAPSGYNIRLSLDDPKSIVRLTVKAKNELTGEETEIGSISNPSLPDLALQWPQPTPGRYLLIVTGELNSGVERGEELRLTTTD